MLLVTAAWLHAVTLGDAPNFFGPGASKEQLSGLEGTQLASEQLSHLASQQQNTLTETARLFDGVQQMMQQ